MKTQHSSQNHLRKLSSSRISIKKGLSSHRPNQTSSLFGPKKNVVVTYSKTRPVQVVKKNHFHTPETPQVLTPDELQTTEGDQDRGTVSKKMKPASQGGSYTSGKAFLSLEASSLQMTNKLGASIKSINHLSNSSVKSLRQGSSLALRNISNIPIEKTLSRTQCTPNRNDSQRVYQDTGSISLRKRPKMTPVPCSWFRKRRKELIKKTKECKKLKEDKIEQENHHQEGEKPKRKMKSSSNSNKTGSLHSDETNYSAKSMSSCTTASSGGASKQGHSGTFTVKSMSLCSTLKDDPNIGPGPVALGSINEQALLPKNSTFNVSGDQVMIQEFFSNHDHLSPIKEQDDGSIKTPTSPLVKGEELHNNNTSSSDKFGNHLEQVNDEAQRTNSCVLHHQNANSSNIDNRPKTSTPTDQGKLPAQLEVDISPILEASDGKKESHKHTDTKETSVKRTEKVSQGTDNMIKDRCGKDKSETLDFKAKPEKHKTTHSLVEDLKENSKTSLPLQASVCIEDDSDPEDIQDNITPELMEPQKSCPSSSKRKLDYGGALNRHDKNVCFLLDLKHMRKKPCKLWMRRASPTVTNSKKMCVPQDVLAIT